MTTNHTCETCSVQLPPGNIFCSACGSVAAPGGEIHLQVECETHPNQHAVGCCVICGRPVCATCRVAASGKILCRDPEHSIMLQEWCILRQPESEFEADGLVRNLADGGIEAKSFSLHDHVSAHWLKEIRVVVFVKKKEYEKAQNLLQELNLTD
jgi:hypothetical protein